MKKLLLILSIICLFGSFTWVFGDTTAAAPVTVVTISSLEDAIKLLESNNTELKLMDQKIELLKEKHQDTLREAKKAEDDDTFTASQLVSKNLTRRLDPVKAQFNIDNAVNDRTEKLKSLKLSVKTQYANLQMSLTAIENAKTEISNLDLNIKDMKARAKLGLVRDIDIKSLEAQKLTLQAQLNKSLGQYEIDTLTLKTDLGISSSSKLVLIPIRIEYGYFNDYDIANKISGAVARDYSVVKAQKDYELTVLERDTNKEPFDYIPADVIDLETTMAEKEAAINDARLTVEADLWTAYYNLKSLEASVEVEKFNLALAELTLKTTETKAKLGQATQLAVSNDRVAVNNQKIKYQQTINDFMLAQDDFKILLGE